MPSGQILSTTILISLPRIAFLQKVLVVFPASSPPKNENFTARQNHTHAAAQRSSGDPASQKESLEILKLLAT